MKISRIFNLTEYQYEILNFCEGVFIISQRTTSSGPVAVVKPTVANSATSVTTTTKTTKNTTVTTRTIATTTKRTTVTTTMSLTTTLGTTSFGFENNKKKLQSQQNMKTYFDI